MIQKNDIELRWTISDPKQVYHITELAYTQIPDLEARNFARLISNKRLFDVICVY